MFTYTSIFVTTQFTQFTHPLNIIKKFPVHMITESPARSRWACNTPKYTLAKMTSQTWPYERIEDKTKFGLVKEHFSFGFESLGLRLREEEKSW